MNRIYQVFGIIVFFLCANKAYSTDFYLKSSGLPTALGSWGTNTDGSGTAPTAFNGAGHVWHFANRTGVSVSLPTFNPYCKWVCKLVRSYKHQLGRYAYDK
jgi:hypothetical protein